MQKHDSTGQNAPKGRGRKRAAIFGTGLAAFTVGTAALAMFTTNMQPWAPGAVATVTHPTSSAQVVGVIWPGDCNDVEVTVNNSMPKGITITDVGNTGFRGVSDTAASQNGNANRLEDFLTQANVADALDGKTVPANDSRTFTIPNAVCLSAQADDARQGKTFEAGYFIAATVKAGNEAP